MLFYTKRNQLIKPFNIYIIVLDYEKGVEMANVFDVKPSELIQKLGEELKKDSAIKAPTWAAFVKTGVSRERPPENPDWWYIRAAAVLRSVYFMGPIGVSKLRSKYGGRKNRGHKPEHFYKGSGAVIRKILQQLEKAGLVKQVEIKKHKGRVITPKGQDLVDSVAAKVAKNG